MLLGPLLGIVLAALLGSVCAASRLPSTPPAGVPAETVGSPDRVTFGIEPSSVQGPDGRDDFTFGADPGGVLYEHVSVVNYSDVPLQLQVYATDAVQASGGGFGLLAVGKAPTGVGAWLAIQPGDSTVTVPPESSSAPGFVVIPVTMHVPYNATPGDHVGAIVASLRTTGISASGAHIVLYQRVGTRVFVRVAGKLKPGLALTDLRGTYQGTVDPFGAGRVLLTYKVHNLGNTDLSVNLSASVSSLIGADRRASGGRIRLLLPGGTVDERLVVGGVWPGVHLETSVAATAAVLDGTRSEGITPVSDSTSMWAIPWPLIVLIAVFVVALWAVRARRRRSRVPALVAEPAPDLVDA